MDLGQSRRGVDMGASAVRYAGLNDELRALGWVVDDRGNLDIPERNTLGPGTGLDYLPAVVAACTAACRAGRQVLENGDLPIFLGGDHSIAAGTVAAAASVGSTGLLWVDAHGDLNTPETSPSKNIHGMPLAALLGHGDPGLVDIGLPGPTLRPEDVVLVGVRDLDEGEKRLVQELEIRVFTMPEIDELGIAEVSRRALELLSHRDHIHVSLDMDSLDPRAAPGVGTPVKGGLTYREAHLLMELTARDGRLASFDIVEVNPILDQSNETAKLAVGLAASLLGKTIL